MSGHTPGPWAVTARGDKVRRASNPTIICELRRGIGFVNTNASRERAQAKLTANARLIAAAPELLEALEAALPEIEAGEDVTRRSGFADRARAAIAKAKGDE